MTNLNSSNCSARIVDSKQDGKIVEGFVTKCGKSFKPGDRADAFLVYDHFVKKDGGFKTVVEVNGVSYDAADSVFYDNFRMR